MKRLFVLAITLLVLVPAIASAQDPSNYLSFKGGAFFPDSNDFEDGFTGEIAFGHYFNPNLALEGGLGYNWIGDFNDGTVDTGFGIADADIDVDAWYLTVTVKGVFRLKRVELYGGAGVGFYQVSATAVYPVLFWAESVENNGRIFGGHLVAGIQLDLSDKTFLGIEGKYVATNSVTLTLANTTLDVDVQGFSATGVLGFRF